MYKKLSGMTGTADTEAYEFQSIYGLEVTVIPTHRPMIRKDMPDLVFLKKEAKYKAISEDIKACHERGQPVLVGTTSIETSELLSNLLKKQKIPHEVLNAKQHEREAHIVAQAGRPGAVTIATNMAGRGTDIVLGGSLEAELQALGEAASDAERERVRGEWQARHDQVLQAGGLHIIGTERHESRRIDNQLRGRSGRQGDPGSSRFYLSLEDNLMRIFAADWVQKAMAFLGMKEDDAIEDRLVSRQIEKAQRKVEAHNFDIRKNLLDFDDVNNDQRKVIYEQRNELLEVEDVKDTVASIRADVFTEVTQQHVPANSIDAQWDIEGLEKVLAADFGLQVDLKKLVEEREELTAEDIARHVVEAADALFAEKEAQVGGELMRALEKHVMLTVLDGSWKEHLARMDYLRQGIHLRGYAQKQPKQEYKREAFELFSTLIDRVRADVVRVLMNVRVQSQDEIAQAEQQIEAQAERRAEAAQAQHASLAAPASEEPADVESLTLPEPGADPKAQPFKRFGDKIGRNDPCPCGSGKKYKQCHGKLA